MKAKLITFENLGFMQHSNDINGVRAMIFFDNGYGASIIRTKFSYGGEDGLYELAVLKGNNNDWDIDYDTHITDDVVGGCSPEDITKLLKQIQELPKAQ